MYLKAHAKINIVLNVLGKRKDGYHTLDMVVLPLNVHDTIATNRIFSKKKESGILINDVPTIYPNDICGKVIRLMMDKYNIKKKYEFAIYKEIPSEAGLGGGSSDAASIFNFYNKKFKLNISNEEAIKMLLPFGSDIPFFVTSKPARVQGIGEMITPITIKDDYYVLIVKPKAGLSTKDVYKALDDIKIPTYNVDNVIKALETGDDELLINSVGNVLEIPAMKLCPKVKEIKEYLLAQGFRLVLMSGSGTATYAISKDKEKIIDVANKIKALNYNVFYTKVLK